MNRRTCLFAASISGDFGVSVWGWFISYLPFKAVLLVGTASAWAALISSVTFQSMGGGSGPLKWIF